MIKKKKDIIKIKKRCQIFNIILRTKKKLYINVIKSFLKRIRKNNKNYSFDIKKKLHNIIVNKSPHVNVKAKKKYLDSEYLMFLKNIEATFYNFFKRIILVDTRYVFLKKII